MNWRSTRAAMIGSAPATNCLPPTPPDACADVSPDGNTRTGNAWFASPTKATTSARGRLKSILRMSNEPASAGNDAMTPSINAEWRQKKRCSG